MEVERERLKLRDDPKLISPPSVDPAWQCGTAVVIRGFIANASLDVELDGAVVVAGTPGGFPQPNGARIALPNPLIAGQKIRARQKFGGATSVWSTGVTVLDHTVEYPAGPPRPQINPAPVYQCGTRTGVGNLLVGCDVWITANAVEVGRVAGAANQQGVNVAPPYALAQSVVAWASLCKDPSPPSVTQIAQAPPAPMPVPGFLPVYAGGQQLTITNVVNGARLTLSRNGIVQFSFSSWGYQHLVGLNPPFAAGEVLSVTQQLCPGDPPSGDGTVTVLPCSALPAPGVEPVQAGDTSVTLSSFVSDARIQVYVNGVKQGDGSGPVVFLSQAVAGGDTIDVLQMLDTCVSRTVQELTVLCVAPPLGGDPSARDLFPVGTTSYDAGPFTVTSGHSQHVAGTIYYPADADGANTPFNQRLAKLARAPLAVLVHGRHGGTTSHLGYDYFQQQLARMGMIVASVDCNASDQWGGWADNIRDRADLVIASIAHLQSLDSGGDPIFGGRIDFARVGLMGHSRGGDAVVLVPEIITLAGVTIQGVIALGPVNSGASSGRPQGRAFMTILPASDGDVDTNDGAQFYDGADPAPFKSQLYVYHANHNFFNRQWLNDDTNGGLPIMARANHERILSVYGCAFFRAVLLAHATLGYLDGTLRPTGVLTGNVHLSFKKKGQLTVDDHEDRNGIGMNSMPAPTTQSGGLIADEHPFVQGAAGRFNDSFFGNTVGMVARAEGKVGTFRSELDKRRDLRKHQIWIRTAEVYNGTSVPAGATGFLLGLEDDNGAVAWVDSDGVGGLPRPLDRRAYDLANAWDHRDKTKTMLKTLRFPVSCFKSPPRSRKKFDPRRVVAVRLRPNRADKRALAFDDLQIVVL
jgi:hypothetical protein